MATQLTMSPTSDLPYLISTLASLRVALPSTLLLVLVLRVAVRAFLGMMDRVQSQGWVELPDDDAEAPIRSDTAAAAPTDEDEDAIRPVVVKVREVRKGLVLGLFAVVAGTYFADGAAQGEPSSSSREGPQPDGGGPEQSSRHSSPTSLRPACRSSAT